MRLFIALHPPPEVRSRIVEVQAPLDELPRARLVAPDQLHLTLRFLPDYPSDDLPGLEERLRAVTHQTFDVELGGVGTFGQPPHVVWMGIQPGTVVTRLADAVQVAIDTEPESRPFRPHLTLARTKDPSPVLLRQFVASADSRRVVWRVDAFHLFESRLSNTGATHILRSTFPLTAAPTPP